MQDRQRQSVPHRLFYAAEAGGDGIDGRLLNMMVSMDVSQRLYRLLKAMAADKVSTVSRFIEQGNSLLDEKLDVWEKAYGLGTDPPNQDSDRASADRAYARTGSRDRATGGERPSGYATQLVEDLKLFDLQPPSSLEAVKKARNRELKKFHPDKYQNDPEKMAIANQIVRLYNTAFERLRRHYEQP